MKYAQVVAGCALIKIAETEKNSLTLDEQVMPFLGKKAHLLLDLNDVNVSSTVIGELVNLLTFLRRDFGRENTTICLLNLNEQGVRVLETTKLNKEFVVCENLEQAFQAINAV